MCVHIIHIMRRKLLVGGRKRRVRRVIGGRRRRMAGSGFFGNIWNGIKRAATGAHDFIKNNRLISRGLALIPDARARAAGTAAGALGYGRRRRYRKRRLVGGRKRRARLVGGRKRRYRKRVRRVRVIGGHRRKTHVIGGRRKRTMRGRGIMSALRSAHDFVKRHRLVSRGLNHFGHSRLSSAASALGYGRRRKRSYRKRR
jgi:hypothetical protein